MSIGVTSGAWWLWRKKWNLARLLLALVLLWAVAIDTGARLARLQLAAMPDYDYVGEVRKLRSEGRFGEALVFAEAGESAMRTAHSANEDQDAGHGASGAGDGDLAKEKQLTIDERDSWWRKAKDVGLGAVSGQGATLERLIGAVAADMLVIGDVRDLVIQGTKLALDGEADPVIVSLSGLGLVLTLAPEIDWAASVLKIARKTGTLSKGLGEWIVESVKARKAGALSKAMGEVGVLTEKASPGGAMRILRHADDAKDLERLAAFSAREEGAFALLVTDRAGAKALQGATEATREATERAVVAAARKGSGGAAWLASPAARAVMRPHPLIGLAKGFYKGNVQALAARVAEWLDPKGWWIVALLGAWVVAEGAWLLRPTFAFRGRSFGSAAAATP